MSESPADTRPSGLLSTPGIVLALGGTALLALLLVHPDGQVHGLIQLVDFEIRHRQLNALVHGAGCAVLVLLLAGHVGVLRQLPGAPVRAALAVSAFGAGAVLMMASLVQDGFLVPALAAQFHAIPGEGMGRQAIGAIIQACATSMQILMWLGLLFFAASALVWSSALARLPGRARPTAVAVGVIGVLLAAMLLFATREAPGHVMQLALVLLAAWQIVLAGAVPGRTVIA
jgi:hypothetical protein